MSMLNQGVDYGLGVFAVHLGHHDVACLTLYQGGDLAVVGTEDQISFPVTRHGSILRRWRALADRDRVADPAVILSLLRVMTRATHPPCSPEVLQQLFLQGATGLDK